MIFTFVVLVISVLLLVFYVMHLKTVIESLDSKISLLKNSVRCEQMINEDLKKENIELVNILWSNAKWLNYQSMCSDSDQVCDCSRESASCS